jgi:hypothetical protein
MMVEWEWRKEFLVRGKRKQRLVGAAPKDSFERLGTRLDILLLSERVVCEQAAIKVHFAMTVWTRT